MAFAARLSARMQKEFKLLATDPPHGVTIPAISDDTNDQCTSMSMIHARVRGPEGSVYEEGIFGITIQIPERYPFQPPNVLFTTPIYHPNIDTGGRICLDILNLPPKGAWQPSLNISTVLTSIGLLLSEPNPDDSLMCEASREYKYHRQIFDQKARACTRQYASLVAESKETAVISETVASEHEEIVKQPCSVKRKLSLASRHLKNREYDADKKNTGHYNYGREEVARSACNHNEQVQESPDIVVVSDSEESEEESHTVASSTLLSLRRKRLERRWKATGSN